MSNEKVSALPSVASATTADTIYAIQGGVSVKETIAQVLSLALTTNTLTYAGDPNGNLAGTVLQSCWDSTNLMLWICSASGSTSTAVWKSCTSTTLIGQTGTGTFVGSISPTMTTPVLGVASATSLDISSAAGLTINSLKPVVTVKTQQFTANGTYTPSTGMLYCEIELVGGGGGAGGMPIVAAGQYGVSGSGSAGGYSRKLITAATIGASQAVTVGAGGTGGAAGANPGVDGGTTSVGALIQATGGAGGLAGVAGAGMLTVEESTPGVGSLGDINIHGLQGTHTLAYQPLALMIGANGGVSYFGGNNAHSVNTGAVNADDYGCGAPGNAFIIASAGGEAGGNGSSGFVIITEYCNQ